MSKISKNNGFTLIEILIVIGIIAILASIVVIAINPAKQFAQARNAQRTANVNAILNAIGQRIADNKGIFEGHFTIGSDTYHCGKIPKDISNPITFTPILSTNGTTADETEETGKLGCLVPTYISILPSDPTYSSGTDTLYKINMNDIGRISVCAPLGAESTVPDSAEICVTR